MVVPPNHPKLEPFSIEPYGDFGDVSPKEPPPYNQPSWDILGWRDIMEYTMWCPRSIAKFGFT